MFVTKYKSQDSLSKSQTEGDNKYRGGTLLVINDKEDIGNDRQGHKQRQNWKPVTGYVK